MNLNIVPDSVLNIIFTYLPLDMLILLRVMNRNFKEVIGRHWLNYGITNIGAVFETLSGHDISFHSFLRMLCSSTSEFRICGGAVLSLLTRTESHISDMDVFIKPLDVFEVNFNNMMYNADKVLVFNRQNNERSAGTFHDIKVYDGRDVTREEGHWLDVVTRESVNKFEWIDCLACKSGLYYDGNSIHMEVWDSSGILNNCLAVKDIKEQRRTKLLRKGYTVRVDGNLDWW